MIYINVITCQCWVKVNEPDKKSIDGKRLTCSRLTFEGPKHECNHGGLEVIC